MFSTPGDIGCTFLSAFSKKYATDSSIGSVPTIDAQGGTPSAATHNGVPPWIAETYAESPGSAANNVFSSKKSSTPSDRHSSLIR